MNTSDRNISNRLHKFLFSGSALVAVAMLAACGGGGNKDDSQASTGDKNRCPVEVLKKTTKPIEVTFWHGMADVNEETLKAMVNDYNASQSKVKVTLQLQGTYDDVAKKYLATLREGNPPEIVQVNEPYLRSMIDSKSVIPIQVCLDADNYETDDYLAIPLAQNTVDQKLWAMPFNVSVPVLYFNATAFKKAGLDPATPPTNFEELRAASEKLVSSGAARSGVAFELKPAYLEQWSAMAGVSMVDHANGRDGLATKATFDNKTGLGIYQFIDQMLDDKLAISVGRNRAGFDHLLALAKGDAAMTFGTSAALGSVLNVLASGQFPDVEAAVASMPIPGTGQPASNGGVLIGGGSLYIVEKGTTPEQRAGSWDFTKWLNEPAQQARLHVATGYVPLRSSSVSLPEVVDAWKKTPQLRVAYDSLLASKATKGGPVIGSFFDVSNAIVASLERMTIEGEDPSKALSKANADATKVIKDYNKRMGN